MLRDYIEQNKDIEDLELAQSIEKQEKNLLEIAKHLSLPKWKPTCKLKKGTRRQEVSEPTNVTMKDGEVIYYGHKSRYVNVTYYRLPKWNPPTNP